MWQDHQKIGVYAEIANFIGCLMTVIAFFAAIWIGTQFIFTQSRRK